jgi:hypothetical protein
MSTNTILAPGYYLGIRQSIRNFSFTVPKASKGIIGTDMDKWFNQLGSGRKVTTNAALPTHNPGNEKSTTFSGWKEAVNAECIATKCLAAPEMIKAAGGDDYKLAEELVRTFKQKATAVLSRCCETQEAITEAVAAEINECACLVHEIKVVLLCVSETQRPGFRHDSNTNRWYAEKTVRKFYLRKALGQSLLEQLVSEFADPTTTVNAERKLVAVRNNKAGRSASTSSFRIVNVSDTEAMMTDAQLMAAIKRIRAKMVIRPEIVTPTNS